MAAPDLPGVRRVEHVIGMPILVDLRDDGVDDAALARLFARLESVDRDLQHLQGRQ